MNTNRILFFSAVALIILIALGHSSVTVAQEDESATDNAMVDDGFEVGGSCAALAYMNQSQVKAFISSGFSDDFHSFCFPEEPSECSDYTAFLKGLGRLTTGDDGYHCSLQLQF